MKTTWVPAEISATESIVKTLQTLAPIDGLADFSRILVIVPGRLHERQLKEALAVGFPDGVCPPHILTPGGALRFGCEEFRGASSVEEIEVWEEVLKAHESSPELDLLLPRRRTTTAENDRRNLAKSFASLRQELVKNGKTIADAAEILSTEDGRWGALSKLETWFTETLNSLGLPDSAVVEREYAAHFEALAEHFLHIVIAFVPDLPQLLVQKLAPVGKNITLLVRGNADDEADFDLWGRPEPGWGARKLPFEAMQLHTANTVQNAALLALDLATEHGAHPFDPEESAIVLGRAAFFPAAENVFNELKLENTENRVKLFSPEGVNASSLRIGSFLGKLRRVLHSPENFASLCELLRDEAFLGYLRKGSAIGESDFLVRLDRFTLDALPDGSSAALRFMALRDPELAAIVRRGFDAALSLKNSHQFLSDLKVLLKAVFSRPGYPPVFAIAFDDEVRFAQEAINALQDSPVLALLSEAERQLRALLEFFETTRLHPGRDEDALLVYNFLELPALKQKQLFLIGLNWGIVPAVPGTTPYLTDSIRKKLGIANAETLRALETYKLCTVLNAVHDVHLVALKLDEKNSPLRPAGLLFQGCDDAELLTRAGRWLDAEPVRIQTGQNAGLERCFRLNFKAIDQCQFFQKKPLELSVTDFKAYLASPRAFLLERVLRIDCPDYENRELEANDFGTACHRGFEALREAVCETKQEYLDALLAGADRFLAGKCGVPLPLLVSLQQKQIHTRLEAAAEYLAATHGEYRLLEAEYKLNSGNGIEFGGARIRGTIDRIELSADGATLRLVDLKTYNSAVTPESDHLAGKVPNQRLYNFQLPLYERLLRLDLAFWEKHHLDPQDVTITAGYLLLTADSDTAQWSPWTANFSDYCAIVEMEVAKVVAALETFRDTGELAPDPTSAKYYDLAPLMLPNGNEAVITKVNP